MNNLDIAKAFFEAMTAQDHQAIRDLCAPDVRPRQNGGAPMPLEALFAFSKAVHDAAQGFHYANPVRSATASGFVQEHSVRGTLADGGQVDVPVCVIGDVENGKITELREYFDSGIGANLLAALKF